MTFEPTAVANEAELAQWLGMPEARDADHIWQIAEDTACVILRLDSEWWGNETFGVWQRLFFVYTEGVSPSGKALFTTHGIAANDPVRKLRSAERIRTKRGGLTSSAARNFEHRATEWHDHSELPGPGMPPSDDERGDFWDESLPLSAISDAVVTPEGQKAMSADVRTAGRISERHDEKTVLSGETYHVFTESGVKEAVPWADAHLSFDSERQCWTCDRTKDAHDAVVAAIEDAGFSAYGFNLKRR